MMSWQEYIKQELNKEPGILLLAYPFPFLWEPINGGKVRRIWKTPESSKGKAVYIHIPFCKRKCLFCNFVSYSGTPYEIITKYIKHLKKEMELISPLVSPLATDSLCIGGGTPNLLGKNELEEVLKTAHKFMNLNKETEISIEIIPDGSINTVKLKLMKDYGVNRISLGIQSFDDKVKRICNRPDTTGKNIEIYKMARKTGFNNINFDLIFGLPGQSFKSWRKTLTITARLEPEHISVYPLSARNPQIPFYEYIKHGDVKKTVNLFNFTKEFLTKKGYFQTSRYWYVKKGVRYKYNECCSELTPLLGLGINSISYKSNFTYKNTPKLKEYFSALDNGKLPVEKGYALKGKDIMRNYIIRKITYLKVEREEFKRHFGKDMKYCFGKAINILEKFNLIGFDKRHLKLTAKGTFYSALVKRCFCDFNILKKKEAYYKNIYLK